MFAGNFAPRMWAFCEGQLLPISQNQALFSLLGTMYGGDGVTTFGLPDFRGRCGIGPGQGPALPNYNQAAKTGAETTTLNVTNLPSHTHVTILRSSTNASLSDPSNAFPAPTAGRNTSGAVQVTAYANTADSTMAANSVSVGNTGGSIGYDNMQPYLALHFIIATQGLFPSRG